MKVCLFQRNNFGLSNLAI